MVGLPARGKTYISKKLTRYLNWIGMPTKGTQTHTQTQTQVLLPGNINSCFYLQDIVSCLLLLPLCVCVCYSLQCGRVPQGGGEELQLLRLLQAR